MSVEIHPQLSQKHAHLEISGTSQILSPALPLKDDLDCVEQLSMGPPTDPPYRLLFLFHVLLQECSLNRKLAVEIWLQIIRGVEGREDLWLWEDGDEEWLRSNIRRPEPGYSRCCIYSEDWEQAGNALESRISRAQPRILLHDNPQSRIFIIGWRLIVSGYLVNARTKRGLVPHRDSALDVDSWYSSIHQLFEIPNVNHVELRATFLPAIRGDAHQCTMDMSMIKDWVGMISKLHSPEQVVSISKTLCGCDKCASIIGGLALDGPQHFFREFLSIGTTPLLLLEVSIAAANETPGFSLVISWVLYYYARLNLEVEPTIMPLIFYIETATIDDFHDLWSLTQDQEECLKQHLIVDAPDHKYASWINEYPRCWRGAIALLSTEDWLQLRDAVTTRLHDSAKLGLTPNRRPLSFPDDAYVWMGCLVWIMLEDFSGLAYSSPQIWFHVWDDSEHLLQSWRLPRPKPAAVTEKFVQLITESGHTCYADYGEYLHWYALMMSWLRSTDVVQIMAWEAADPVEERECPACIQIHAFDEPLVQMRPPVDIMMLCGFLSSWDPKVDPWVDPLGWIAANVRNLSWVLRQATNLTERDIPLECLMFPRLTIYAYAHLRCCGTDTMLLRALRQTLESCRSWTDVDGFLKHKDLGEDLMTLLRKCRYYDEPCCRLPEPQSCDEKTDDLLRIEFLDVINVYAHFAVALNDPERHKILLSCRGAMAQSLLNHTQQLVDAPHLDWHIKHPLLVFLVQLSRKSNLYPDSLVIRGIHKIGRHLVDSGAFGDVWKGIMLGDLVAIKIMKIRTDNKFNLGKAMKKFFREAVLWRQLSHPNVLPFYGVHYVGGDRISLISPWMDNGSIIKYLQSFPNADRIMLLHDVASGLRYLHSNSPPIVHGDLKGANIFITPSGRACIADLGLSSMMESTGSANEKTLRRQAPEFLDQDTRPLDSQGASRTSAGGTLRWQAPELLRTDICPENTMESDMYAFGCVCYEVFTGKIPFYDLIPEPLVWFRVLAGEQPRRPPVNVCTENGMQEDLHDHLWYFMRISWRRDAAARPTAKQAAEFFGDIMGEDTRPPALPHRRPLDNRSALDYAYLIRTYAR